MKWYGYILIESPFCEPHVNHCGAFRWRWMAAFATYFIWYVHIAPHAWAGRILITQNPDVGYP